jgi:hypothetical protein
MIVVECYDWKKRGRQAQIGTSSYLAKDSKTEKELADLAHTTDRTIRQAKVAEKAGLGDAVLNGEISAKAAAESVNPKLPKPNPDPDNKFKARILELESELESANERIATLNEMLADYDTIKTEHEAMSKVLDEKGNNQLKSAMATIKQQAAMIRVLEERVRGLQGERNMAIKAAKRVRK